MASGMYPLRSGLEPFQATLMDRSSGKGVGLSPTIHTRGGSALADRLAPSCLLISYRQRIVKSTPS